MATLVMSSCLLRAEGLTVTGVKFNPLQYSSRSRAIQQSLSILRLMSTQRRLPRTMAVLVETPSKRVQEEAAPGPSSQMSSETKVSMTFANYVEMGQNDTSLESTMEQRLWVGAGAAAVVGMLTKAVTAVQSPADAVAIGVAVVGAYVVADLGTGVYHWGVDNYGSARTPVFGSQIDAFQGHHKRPWTITKRQFANNVHAIARPVAFALAPFLALPSNSALDAFLGTFLGLVVMSQQFHAWAHMKKSQLPSIVVSLQDNGVLISRKMHGAHHLSPYEINYCIVSGMWNPMLDENKVFPLLESVIHSKFGVAPRCWFETEAEWLQEGSYFEDGSGSTGSSEQ